MRRNGERGSACGDDKRYGNICRARTRSRFIQWRGLRRPRPHGYALDQSAYAYALKRRILSGRDVSPDLSVLGEDYKEEVLRFNRVVGAVHGYLASFDGDFRTYIGQDIFGALTDSEKADAARYRASGSFDDPFFEDGANSAGIKGYLDDSRDASNTALASLASYEEDSLIAHCKSLMEAASIAALKSRIASDCDAIAASSLGAWRANLGIEGFITNKNDAAKIDDTALSFAGLQKVDGVLNEKNGIAAYYSANARVNDGLESAARLNTLAVSLSTFYASWITNDVATVAATSAYLADTSAIALADPVDHALPAAFGTFKARAASQAASLSYQKSRKAYAALVAQQTALAETLESLGETVELFKESKGKSIAEAAASTKAKMAETEKAIDGLELEWEKAIDDPSSEKSVAQGDFAGAGYRQLEEMYTSRYAAAQAAYKTLESRKQESKIAKAIYEYASTPYLRTGSKSGEDGTATGAGLVAVDPDTRLEETVDHVRRAAAAVDALESLYASQAQYATLYERDATYRSLKDEYERAYRGKLAVLQAQTLLDTEIGYAKAVYERDKDAYENAVSSTSSAPIAFGSDDDMKTVNEWLTELRGSFTGPEMLTLFNSLRISNGTVSFSSGGFYDEQSIALYFTRGDDEAFSEFERDLSDWMIRNQGRDMGEWSEALTWEELNLTGEYETWDHYYQRAYDKVVAESWYNPNAIQAFMGNIQWLKSLYASTIAKPFEKSVLSIFGGSSGDDDLEKAIRAYCYTEELETMVGDIHAAYNASKNDTDYAFFKLLAMYNLLPGKGLTTSIALVDSTFAAKFYNAAREVCQDAGKNHPMVSGSWHNARDDATSQRNAAARIRDEIAGSIAQSQKTIATSMQNYLSSKAALAVLIGGDPEGGAPSVTIDRLVESIMNASGRNATKPIDDILTLAGYAITESTPDATKRLYLRALLGANGKNDVSGAYQSVSVFMDAIMGSYGDRIAEAGTELDTYLYSDGTGQEPTGIAVAQRENGENYRLAYDAFVNGGILSAGEVTATTVGQWEAAIASDAKNPQTGIALIADKTREYLETRPEKAGEDLAIANLRAAWESWRKASVAKIGVVGAAQTLRDSFSSVASGYRAGFNFTAALAKTWDRRNETTTSAHVYDSREDSIRTYETYLKILGDFQGEKSYIRDAGREAVIADLREALVTLNANRLAAYTSVRESEWDLQKTALEQEQKQFEEQMDAVLSRGITAWTRSGNTLRAAAETWQNAYERSFADKCALWNDRYAAFVERKDAWAKDLVTQAMCLGDKTILNRIPTITQDAIREATAFIVADVIEAPEPDILLSSILDEDLLSGLLGSAKNLGNGVAGFTPVIFQKLKRASFTNAEILDRVRTYQTREDDELQAHLAFIQYNKAMDTLKNAKGEIEQSLEDSNERTWKSFKNMFLDSGFKQNGDNFTKETPVGATLMDNIYETHTILGYQRFKTEVKDFAKDFALPEGLDYATVGSDGMEALLKQVMDTVPKEYDLLYGERDKDGNFLGATYERQYMADEAYTDTKTRYDEASKSYVGYIVEKTRKINATATSDATGYEAYLDLADELGSSERVVVKNNGKFNDWVGYAPVMKDDADSALDLEDWQQNVKFEGAGETGRLMGLYIQHKMIENAGQAEARQPAYNRKLWDDRGSWMQAPNLRTVTDIAMTIAAGVIAPGAGAFLLNAALNMIDDAVFTLMDMSSGMDPFTAAEGFMKKAAVSLVSGKAGGAGFAGAGKLLGNTAGTIIGQSIARGASIFTSNVASSAINSFSVRSLMEGGAAFDADAFGNGVIGKGAMASVAAGMAGTYVTGSLDASISNSSLIGFSDKYFGGVRNLTGTLGNIASTGVTYGMTGNASVNLLNTSMFGLKNKDGGIVNTGLFELSFGKDGTHGAVSMSGTDLNVGKLMSSLNGLTALDQNKRIAAAKAKNGGNDISVMQRALFSYGDKQGKELYEASLSGKALVEYGNTSEDEKGKKKLAETVKDENGVYHIKLAQYSDNAMAQILEAVVMQHEAYRDGEKSANQQGETESAVKAHIEMAKRIRDDGLYTGLIESSGFLNNEIDNLSMSNAEFSKYVAGNYDSSRDYWKLKKDGSIAYDGFASLRDEDGTIIRSASSMGVKETQVEGGLIQILGLDKNNPEHIAAVQNMMKGSGMIMNAEGFWNKDGVVKTITQNGKTITLGMNLNQYNQDKTISLGMIGSLYKSLSVGKEIYQGFIENNFKSAKTYLSMTSMVEKIDAEAIYGKAYSKKEQKMISYNFNHNLDVGKIVPGATVTQNFEEQLTDYQLADGSLYSELHTGIDQQKIGGDSIYTPDGYWFVRSTGNGLLTLEQYGTGVRWRMAHLDPSLVNKLDIGSSFSPDQKVIDYPDDFYGSTGGQNPHLHSEFTGVSNWKRTYKNPTTWTNGTYSAYSWQKKNNQNQIISSGYFNSNF